MNITEANDINTLLRWVTGMDSPLGPVPDDLACEAAAALAQRAHKKLMAGMDADDVWQHWPEGGTS